MNNQRYLDLLMENRPYEISSNSESSEMSSHNWNQQNENQQKGGGETLRSVPTGLCPPLFICPI